MIKPPRFWSRFSAVCVTFVKDLLSIDTKRNIGLLGPEDEESEGGVTDILEELSNSTENERVVK